MNVSLIENQINIAHLDKYAAIIGENPSNGARSPKLWNAVFNECGLNYSMLPFDVTKDNILNLLDELNQDINFIGGAIAVPYKEVVAKWLGRNTTTESRNIGAVNCLYRNNNGKLEGTNTDGEGSLISYTKQFGSPFGKKILLLGTGGVARAVAAYFSSKIGKKGGIYICGRLDRGKDYARVVNANWISWDEVNNLISKVDIVINCTSIGYGDQEGISPIKANQFKFFNKSTIIFDVIYQPLETEFLKLAKSVKLRAINGLNMNLEQAVISFIKTNPGMLSDHNVADIMRIQGKSSNN
jgi:shikimate dehydrogenase